MNKGFYLSLRRSYHAYNHIPTVKLSSSIVEGGRNKHMIVLHGLFGNKSTFRYLAINEKVGGYSVIRRYARLLDKREEDVSFAGCEESWTVRESHET